MSRKRDRSVRRRTPKSTASQEVDATAAPALPRASPLRTPYVVWMLVVLIVVAATAAGFHAWRKHDVDPRATLPPSAPPTGKALPRATFSGSQTCASCHAKEFEAWRGSQHAAAMQDAREEAVLGNFENARMLFGGVPTTFFRRNDRYYVRTDGSDGQLATYEVKHAFGIAPLQQYLIELPGGRLQALGHAWDARPRAAGGQRWFHLFSERKPKPGDTMHWTGIDQNWNQQCADCHSTNLRKGFDEHANRFSTTWSEISVGCEACHGPASNHLVWANKQDDWRRFDIDKGLSVALDERKGVAWTRDADTGNPTRSRPRSSNRELDVCARCHSRRSQFSDDHHAGQTLHDAFRLALIQPGLYHADGQQRDEVFTYGSFLQSKMHAQGVSCSDCHDPHTQRVRGSKQSVCATCHTPAKYDDPSHHHHARGTQAAQCTACHMPTTTYMIVDPRHDHSMRIPRPDRSVALGTPNACNGCHVDRTAQWAADAVRRWYPQPRSGFQTFAEAFDAAERGAPGTRAMLIAIAQERAQPGIVRASALARLEDELSETSAGTVVTALSDSDALVRLAAVEALARTNLERSPRLLSPMLRDPARTVRMAAARGLAGPAERQMSAEVKASFDAALAEYLAAEHFVADRPEAHINIGMLALVRGRLDDAEASFRRALAIDPSFAPAVVSLADLKRNQGMEADGERVLRAVLHINPDAAVARHALGLSLVRQKRMQEAVVALDAAARIAPENARYSYAYGIALHDTGRRPEAIRVLTSALARHPFDREILYALATYEIAAGRRDQARNHARLLRELAPENTDYARLATILR